jgi:transposase-like protein
LPPATDTLGRKITRRRLRSVEEKRRIVEETLVPGTSVAEIARRHGLNANLLFGWRRLHEQGRSAHSAFNRHFVNVGVPATRSCGWRARSTLTSL